MRSRHFPLLIAIGAAGLLGVLGPNAAAHDGGTGSIKGKVKLVGTPPALRDLNMSSDPYCAKQKAGKDEDLVLGAGGMLKNVIVRISKGAAGDFPAPTTPATIDQNGCMYRPRVQVLRKGQPVTLKNSDQTLHNVHSYNGMVTAFNIAQAQGFPDMTKKFPAAKAGDVVKFKCDVHPWMTGYVVVSDNPFHAVSAADGTFELKDVPPGTYTLTAWHERLGTKDVPVTVTADKATEVKIDLGSK